jgi:hypothetical protein
MPKLQSIFVARMQGIEFQVGHDRIEQLDSAEHRLPRTSSAVCVQNR